jgi:beta-barrel assembly-enhancing protease
MMLSLLAAAAVLATPQLVCCGSADPRVDLLVSMAWQEQAQPPAQQTAEPQLDPRHQAEIQRDVELGAKYSEMVDKELKPTKEEEFQERVDRIGGQLAEVANRNQVRVTWGDRRLSPFKYTFKVVQGDDVNAFSLPGGFIYIYDGLVRYTETDHELAGVIGHEIAHAAFRHVATLQREQSRMQNLSLPFILLAIFMGGEAGGDVMRGTQLVNQAIGSGWHLGAEQSADLGGMQYLSQSPYDPSGLVTFMERLARDDRAKSRIDWGIFQTHPPSRERADFLIREMRNARLPLRRSISSTSFRTTLKTGGEEEIEAWFNNRKLFTFAGPGADARAKEAAIRLDAFFDEVPELFEVQAVDHQLLGKRRLLFEIDPEDARAAGRSSEALATEAVKSVRGAIYSLSFRIWDGR